MSSVVLAARLREQPAPTTAYTASLELFCVIYAIQFCLMRSSTAFPSQPWSLGACRSAAGRYDTVLCYTNAYFNYYYSFKL